MPGTRLPEKGNNVPTNPNDGRTTRGGPKKTGFLGGKLYKENIIDIVQNFNAR